MKLDTIYRPREYVHQLLLALVKAAEHVRMTSRQFRPSPMPMRRRAKSDERRQWMMDSSPCASGASTRPQADGPERQIDIIADHKEVRRAGFRTHQNLADGFAGGVHKCLGFRQNELLPLDAGIANEGPAPSPSHSGVHAAGKQVERHKPHIVPRTPIAQPGVSQADDYHWCSDTISKFWNSSLTDRSS